MSLPPPYAYPHPGAPPERPELPEGVPGTPPWPPWTAPVALVAGFAMALVGAILVAVLATIGGYGIDDQPPGVTIAATVVQDLALVGAAVVFARMTTRPRLGDFGLRAVSIRPSVKWMAIGWGVFFIFSAIWAAVLNLDETDDLPKELGADKNHIAALVAVAVLVCVVAPICEELFFRGFFFTALRNWHGPWLAVVLTGLVFGGIHVGSAPAGFLVPLMVLGGALCVIYWKTGSLLPCIALHSLNNALAFGVSQNWGWEVPLLMAGALAAIAAILAPILRSSVSVSG
jgi:membrane protease YdiL (CAAX protease family)